MSSSHTPVPREARTPAQMSRPATPAQPGRLPAERQAFLAQHGPSLALEPDGGEAMQRWAAHVAAGRIGVPAPAPTLPPAPGCGYGLVSLARIFASVRRPWDVA